MENMGTYFWQPEGVGRYMVECRINESGEVPTLLKDYSNRNNPGICVLNKGDDPLDKPESAAKLPSYN